MSGTLFDPDPFLKPSQVAKRSISGRGGLVAKFLGTTVATGAGFAFGRAAGPILAPPLQLLRNEINERYDYAPLTPQQAAQAFLVDAKLPEGGIKEAQKSGVNPERFRALQAMAGTAPGVMMLLAAFNRLGKDEEWLRRGLGQLSIRDEYHDEIISLRYQLPSGDEFAQMAVQGVMDYDDAQKAALLVGTNATTFDRLYRLHGNPIPPEEALRLWLRKDLDESEVNTIYRQSQLKPQWLEKYKLLRWQLPSLTDLVRMAVREVFSPTQRAALDLDAEFPEAFAEHAEKIGLRREDAANYWAAHWDLPSYSQLVEMLYRTDMDEGEFRDSLKAIDIAPKWRQRFLDISRRIPPLSDMIRFAVREVYSPAQRRTLGLDADYPPEFTAEAALHGMDEARAKQYWAAHWRLPSAQQGYQFLYRTDMTAAELDDLLKALDYPKKWRERLAEIAHREPGRIDLRRFLAEGLIDRNEVKRGYLRLGYKETDAERLTLLAEKLAAKTEGGGGFVQKAQTQLWTTTHRSFMSGESTPAQAKTKLGQAGVPTAERDAVVAVWTNERELIRKQLTAAQVKKAYVKAVKNQTTGEPWTREDALAALVERGYSVNDANEYLDI